MFCENFNEGYDRGKKDLKIVSTEILAVLLKTKIFSKMQKSKVWVRVQELAISSGN